MVTHLSTNPAQCSLTLLIRPTTSIVCSEELFGARSCYCVLSVFVNCYCVVSWMYWVINYVQMTMNTRSSSKKVCKLHHQTLPITRSPVLLSADNGVKGNFVLLIITTTLMWTSCVDPVVYTVCHQLCNCSFQLCSCGCPLPALLHLNKWAMCWPCDNNNN